MKLNNLFLSLVVLVIFSGCASNLKERSAKQNDTVSQLNTLDKEDRKIALFEKLSNDLPLLNSVNQIKPYLDWLQKKVLFDGETFRYSTMYAFYLWKVQKKETAEVMILHAQLRLETDFSRCKNKNNSLSKYTGWYEGGKIGSEILKSYNNRDSESKKSTLKLVFTLEEKQKNRKGDPWLCSSINWAKALKQYDALKKKEATSDSTHLGRVVEVEADEKILLNASFVPSEKWIENRSKAIKKFGGKYQ